MNITISEKRRSMNRNVDQKTETVIVLLGKDMEELYKNQIDRHTGIHIIIAHT